MGQDTLRNRTILLLISCNVVIIITFPIPGLLLYCLSTPYHLALTSSCHFQILILMTFGCLLQRVFILLLG
jgi:hypothetical protein